MEAAATLLPVVGPYLKDFFEYEASYDGQIAINWTGAHLEVPVFALAAYLFIIFYIPPVLKSPFKIRNYWAYWNLLLSLFSIIGTSRCVPALYRELSTNGFQSSVCKDPSEWYLNGPSGLWTTLFVFSKLPELIDTIFLVFQKKPIIFLHWFHHVTVLLYCWHAFTMRSATGLWFISMNFSVHSIMYGYYFFAIIGMKGIARKIAPSITTIQIAQMLVGTVVTAMSAYWHGQEGVSCKVDPANFKMGLGMYMSYFILFASLFYDKYIAKEPKNNEPKKNICGGDVTDKTDSAGLFHRDGSISPSKKDAKKSS